MYVRVICMKRAVKGERIYESGLGVLSFHETKLKGRGKEIMGRFKAVILVLSEKNTCKRWCSYCHKE